MRSRAKTATVGLASVSAFPEMPSVKWRREFAACRCYTDALSLAFRLIREMEHAERPSAKTAEQAKHQLAFPWSRAD
jgi:hypothetical protein